VQHEQNVSDMVDEVLQQFAKRVSDVRCCHHERVLEGSKDESAGRPRPRHTEGRDRVGLRRVVGERRALAEAAPGDRRRGRQALAGAHKEHLL
jgi:hypothetical protein